MKKLYLALAIISSLILTFGCCSKTTAEITKPTTQEFHEHLTKSTVALVYLNEANEMSVYCSGVWIDEEHFVTAHHCVSDDEDNAISGSPIQFSLYDEIELTIPPTPPNKQYAAVIVDSRAETDIALIKAIHSVPHHYVALSTNESIYPGMEVLIVGHTLGLGYSHMEGMVSEVRYVNLPFKRWDAKMIHVTSLIAPGNSGGGMFDERGHLIGLASFIRTDTPGMSFFSHRDGIIQLLREHKLGISLPNL